MINKVYHIVYRWPKWSRWKRVIASPHGERYPFNDRCELEFTSLEKARKAVESLNRWNAGEYRIEGD